MNSFFLGGRLDSGKQQVALSYLVSGWDPLNSVTLEPLSFFFYDCSDNWTWTHSGRIKDLEMVPASANFYSASKSRSDWNAPAGNETKAPFLNFLSLFCTQLHPKLGINFFSEFYKGAFSVQCSKVAVLIRKCLVSKLWPRRLFSFYRPSHTLGRNLAMCGKNWFFQETHFRWK